MKTIQITKREQHLLMTAVRVVVDSLQRSQYLARNSLEIAILAQPGLDGKPVPTVEEWNSVLERLSSNDEE